MCNIGCKEAKRSQVLHFFLILVSFIDFYLSKYFEIFPKVFLKIQFTFLSFFAALLSDNNCNSHIQLPLPIYWILFCGDPPGILFLILLYVPSSLVMNYDSFVQKYS